MCIRDRVAYTITHHTRQSAVGLPFIRQRNYGGKDVSVTEYTMSEIIASIYAKMEATGLSEGILFIDEINCVSETLAPDVYKRQDLPSALFSVPHLDHIDRSGRHLGVRENGIGDLGDQIGRAHV